MTAAHDLFLAEVIHAQADSRIFHGGRWHYSLDTPRELRCLHHLGGGNFVLPGEMLKGIAPGVATD
jgi:hypothetical protein